MSVSKGIVSFLLLAGVLGSTQPAWSQPAQPELAPKPLVPAELMLLNGFYREYSLKDGETVKHFAPPFHPGRIIYDRQTQRPSLIRSSPDTADSFFFHWKKNKLVCVSGAVSGVGGLADLIPILLHFDRHELEGDEELLKIPIPGDWILREEVPDEQILAGMEKILRGQLQIPVKISVQELERNVLLATGDFRFTPIGDSKRIELYNRSLMKKGGGGGSGDLDRFLRAVSWFIGQRVVSEGKRPPAIRLTWHYNGALRHDMATQEDVQQVMKHVTEQTGMRFVPAVRTVRVLMIERDNRT